ncbi:hypothetical protein NEOKW01_1297 [Nematocida sp. AWRm80]|nr:hypothetical protein NEOKW01_1297 [Nematocida sp. AWRm80]
MQLSKITRNTLLVIGSFVSFAASQKEEANKIDEFVLDPGMPPIGSVFPEYPIMCPDFCPNPCPSPCADPCQKTTCCENTCNVDPCASNPCDSQISCFMQCPIDPCKPVCKPLCPLPCPPNPCQPACPPVCPPNPCQPVCPPACPPNPCVDPCAFELMQFFDTLWIRITTATTKKSKANIRRTLKCLISLAYSQTSQNNCYYPGYSFPSTNKVPLKRLFRILKAYVCQMSPQERQCFLMKAPCCL